MRVVRAGARRFAPLLLAVAVHLASARTARAQAGNDNAAAVELFNRGRRLMEAKNYAEACPLFAESMRLDPLGGTLLNLAFCYELDNRTATAWAYYNDLLSRSRREGRPDRVSFATKHLATLGPKLSRWTLAMGPSEKLVGVEVLRDGQVVPRQLWGVELPIDPGLHQLEVRAPDYKSWAVAFRSIPGQSLTTEVPLLEPQPFDTDLTQGPSTPPPALVLEASRPGPPGASTPPEPDTGRTLAGIVVGGVGAISLGLGTYFGLTAFTKRDDAQALCRVGCTNKEHDRAEGLYDSGERFAHLSTASFGIGLVGVGLGAYFLLTAPNASTRVSRPTSLVPRLGPGSAGLSFTHAW
jgi:hypothetical protein